MKFIYLLIFIVSIQTVFAQKKNELPFIEHLIDKQFYDEVIWLIDNNLENYQERSQQDSLNFFSGWAHYSLKNLNQSTVSFLKVGKESPFYIKSRFFAGYNQTFLKNYEEAREIFSQINESDEINQSLINFEICGISMLQRDWLKANEQLQRLNPNIATINQQVAALRQINSEQARHRPKSPLLAGFMSGIVPGSGKIYAGKT